MSILLNASRRLGPSILFLLLGNLIPMLGVVFLGWDIGLILLIYWLETVVIGLFNIPKILTASRPVGKTYSEDKPAHWFGRLFIAVFFTIHYGGFNFGHGVFLHQIFDLPEIGSAAMIAVAGLAVSHGFSLIVNWFGKGEYKDAEPGEQMFKPYARIMIMHVVILLGGFLIDAFGQPLIALVLLVGLKTFVDLSAHVSSHKDAT